jgi:hypothetical protein
MNDSYMGLSSFRLDCTDCLVALWFVCAKNQSCCAHTVMYFAGLLAIALKNKLNLIGTFEVRKSRLKNTCDMQNMLCKADLVCQNAKHVKFYSCACVPYNLVCLVYFFEPNVFLFLEFFIKKFVVSYKEESTDFGCSVRVTVNGVKFVNPSSIYSMLTPFRHPLYPGI